MPTPSLETKRRQLAKVARDLAASSCPLRPGATHPVPGEGNPDARVVFVGEAPGRKEDETGKPFVGAAGKVLAGLLETIGLTREDVFITSIEKFRPPENRDPKPEEVLACFPFLERQLDIIHPDIVVTLGRHALRRMLVREQGEDIPAALSMDAYHGKPIATKRGYILYPLHHPAAVLYNRKLEPTLRKEFKRILKLLAA